MYTEDTVVVKEKSGFPLWDFIKKLLLIIIFVLLLMWLFPIPNMESFYSSVYRDNINEMKNVAKNYYTNERLPQEIGGKTRLTLEEMESMNLILPFVDKDGKVCDKNLSYVEIEKLDTEYKMVTKLVCPKEEDFIVEYMGCYDKCNDGCGIEKVTYNTLYQYQRMLYEHNRGIVNHKWSAYSNWTEEYKETSNTLERIERTLYQTETCTKEVNSSTSINYSDWSDWDKIKRETNDLMEVETKKQLEWSNTKRDLFDSTIKYAQFLKADPNNRQAVGTPCTPVLNEDCDDCGTLSSQKFSCTYKTRGYVTYYRYRYFEEVVTEEETINCSKSDFVLENEIKKDENTKVVASKKQYSYRTLESYTTYETIWSTLSSLTGWNRTGRTKTETTWNKLQELAGWTKTGETKKEAVPETK